MYNKSVHLAHSLNRLQLEIKLRLVNTLLVMTKDPQKGVRGACPSISKINQVYTKIFQSTFHVFLSSYLA